MEDFKRMSVEELKVSIEKATSELALRSVPDLLDLLSFWAKQHAPPGATWSWDLSRTSDGYWLTVQTQDRDVVVDLGGPSLGELVAQACMRLQCSHATRMVMRGAAASGGLAHLSDTKNRPDA